MSFKDCKIHQTKIIWLVNLMKIFSTDIIWQKEGRVNIVVFNFLSLSLSAFVWPTTLKLCRPSSPPCSLSCLRLDFPQLSNEAPGGSIGGGLRSDVVNKRNLCTWAHHKHRHPALASHIHAHCHWFREENPLEQWNTAEDLTENLLRDTLWGPSCVALAPAVVSCHTFTDVHYF